MVFKGVSTTALTDGGNENPTVDGDVVTSKTIGELYFYGKEEFIYGEDSKWHSLGPQLTTLGDLAYKNNATAAYTPGGTVSQPTFNGTSATITTKGTPSGTVSQPSFTGNATTITTVGTPAGTVSTPTITVTPSTTTVNSITAVGTLPTCTLPVFTANVTNENLALDWSSGSFSQGTLPTKGSDTTVATGISSAVSTQPTFTGSELSSTATYTPGGTVSQPTFSGNQLSSTASYTPAGTVSQPSFTGNASTITAS